MRVVWGTIGLCVLLAGATALPGEPANEPNSRLRRPIGVTLVDDGARLIVANRESGCISIVDLERRTVVAETVVGRRLSDAHVSNDGRQILATDEAAGELITIDRVKDTVRVTDRRAVGLSPVSVQRSADGQFTTIACLWPRRLIVLDKSRRNPSTIDLPFAPRGQLILPGTDKLVVAAAFGGQLGVVDLPTATLEHVRNLGGHNIRGLSVDDEGKYLYLTHQFLSGTTATQKPEIQNGNVLSNNVRKLTIAVLLGRSPTTNRSDEIFSIGDIEAGAGDPASLAVQDGRTYVALAGVNELGIGDLDRVIWSRIPVGRRPIALALDKKRHRAYVANMFSDSISIVDFQANRHIAEIPLATRSPELRPEERGEMLFYDARRSHEGWMSCHSCHPDGHSNGRLNDNFSDGSFRTPKRVLSLLGVKDTGPWAWNGTVDELASQVHNSFEKTMQGTPPTPEEVSDVVAFLRTLPPPPAISRARGTVDETARLRGEKVFRDHKCHQCHQPPTLTSAKAYDVGLDEPNRYNPPSLRGVSQAGPYFHDGRALSLSEALTRVRHQLSEPLPAPDLADLLVFLNSL